MNYTLLSAIADTSYYNERRDEWEGHHASTDIYHTTNLDEFIQHYAKIEAAKEYEDEHTILLDGQPEMRFDEQYDAIYGNILDAAEIIIKKLKQDKIEADRLAAEAKAQQALADKHRTERLQQLHDLDMFNALKKKLNL